MKKNSFILIFIILLLSVCQLLAQTENQMHKLTRIFLEQDLGIEESIINGFVGSVSGNQLNYHSSFPQNMNALISRATDGKMSISWNTAPVPNTNPIHLVWMAGLGVNLGEHAFDLYVNGKKFLTFTSTKNQKWQVIGKNASKLNFTTSYVDGVGDLFGLMVLTLPVSKFPKNKQVTLSVIGQAENSNAWYMTFSYDKTAESLNQTRNSGFWYRLKNNMGSKQSTLEFPSSWAGRTLQLGEFKYTIAQNEISQTLVNLSTNQLKSGSGIYVNNRFIDYLQLTLANDVSTEFHSDGRVVYRSSHSSKSEQIFEISAGYTSKFIKEITELSNGPFSDAILELITSSHQDIAWMDDPLACEIKRDTSILSPAIKLLRDDPEYHYSAEQALMLYEYLDRHPELLPEIQKYSAQGRLEWGASFNQPYEGMYFGESLVRQFYLGRKWLKKKLPGYNPKVYFNIDVPGRTLQMPQIAAKSGVDYMIISRHGKGYFFWQSPDGSKIGVHTPGHYHHASDFLRQSVQSAVVRTPKQIDDRKSDFIEYKLPDQIPFLLSSDMSRPRDMRPLFNAWENIRIVDSETHDALNPLLPSWRYNTFQNVLLPIFSQGVNLPVLKGERPNVWLYIHGPSHHWAISASREGGRLLPVAESFNTISAALTKDWGSYPQAELDAAWLAQIYPDHGWGGHDGHITDELFRKKSEFSRDEAIRLINKAVDKISRLIKVDSKKGSALVVYNPLSWNRDAPIETTLEFNSDKAKKIRLTDAAGKTIPAEFHDAKYNEKGFLESVRLKAVVKDLPPVGYKTLYFQQDLQSKTVEKIREEKENIHENKFFRIAFTAGGIKQIFDKSLKKNLAKPDKFLFGELFILKSEGNGAGEFDAPQLPTTEYFERMSQYRPKWTITASSPFAKTFEIKQKLKNCTVVEKVILFEKMKRIDFEVDILGWDGTKNREFRLAFPLDQTDGEVSYEVPFAKVTVGVDEIPGAAGERYQQFAKDLHPREVLDWISSSDKNSGVTFSSDVAVWDYIDPTENPVSYPVLQPILLASRKSCHWEGNWYLQKGNHHYRFSLISHEPGWQNGYKYAKSSNMPLPVLQVDDTANETFLPEVFSFLNISEPGVLLSTIKKAEEDDNIIVRLYEAEGKNVSANLNWFEGLNQVDQTNLIEELSTDQPLNSNGPLKIGKFAIETFKISKDHSQK